MAMGIHQPGFQLLSLVPPQAGSTAPTFADRPCLLPDQLSIYLSTYRFVPAALALEDIVTSTSSSSFSQRLRLRDGASLPLPNSSVPRQSQTKGRPRNSFIRDFRDVAVYPLTLFIIITWLMFVDTSTDPER
ncbi:hypothetical protein BDZ89DRAFT_1080046 [Hymenopellis radicata]|nr:hypothetical protein BDZ89DRAFT_1080046 [Hymenopellis radicata]